MSYGYFKPVYSIVITEASKQFEGVITMKINLGENLRKFRLKRELTQEQLAEIFNVSPQAISRWENNLSYPDLTMLPSIANFYNTSIDELIGMEEIRNSEKQNDIFSNVHKYRANGMLDEAIIKLRDGIKLYPSNYGMISELALTLTLKNNIKADNTLITEAISLSERVIRNSTSEKCRSTTIANLFILYLKANEKEKAQNLVRTLPHIWECREILLPEMFDGTEYSNELKKAIIKVLVLIYEKIKNFESHKYAKPDNIVAEGLDFDLNGDIKTKVKLLTDFLDL